MDIEATRLVVEIVMAAFIVPLGGILWYLMRKVIADQKAADSALGEFKLHVATNCVLKNDFRDAFDTIFKKLDRIEDRLNQANQHQGVSS